MVQNLFPHYTCMHGQLASLLISFLCLISLLSYDSHRHDHMMLPPRLHCVLKSHTHYCNCADSSSVAVSWRFVVGMGKNGGSSSWFTAAVKRAFGSPTKKITNSCTATTTAIDAAEKKTSKRKEEHEQEEKKRGKRRWMNFGSGRKSNSSGGSTTGHQQEKTTAATVILHHFGGSRSSSSTEQAANDQSHALAVAMATTAAAQAAVATAQAAVEVVRLANPPSLLFKQHFAAVSIQTAFRGYLGRRALRGLKGVVKLQAMVRGQNVRRRAELTLHCIQSLLRVQAQVLHRRDHRVSPSQSTARGGHFPVQHSMEQCFRDGDSYWDSGDDQDDENQVMEEEIRSILQQTHQLWSDGGERSREKVVEEGGRWTSSLRPPQAAYLERRWQRRRASCDSTATSIRTVEMDTRSLNPFPQKQSPRRRQQSNSPASPFHHHHHPISSPKLPPPAQATVVPSYMTTTESAKARFRSQSAPKQRTSVSSSSSPSTHNREQHPPAKKRPSFPASPHSTGDYD